MTPEEEKEIIEEADKILESSDESEVKPDVSIKKEGTKEKPDDEEIYSNMNYEEYEKMEEKEQEVFWN